MGSLAVLVFALASCSPTPPSSDDNALYEAEFERAREEATTDFERDVLEDNVITRDEYMEAKNRHIECIQAFGLTAELRDTGAGVFQLDVSGAKDENLMFEAVESCNSGTILVIEPLYIGILQNPDRRNLDDLTAECLVAVGIVDAPFTGRDYADESETPGFSSRIMDDSEGAKCLQNPSYHTGSGAG